MGRLPYGAAPLDHRCSRPQPPRPAGRGHGAATGEHPPGRRAASPCPNSVTTPAFQQGLRDLGYVEGQNIAVEYRYAEGQLDRLPALAAELVQLAPDVIWLHSTAAMLAAKRTITTIPVVVGVATELEERGIVASLARPGGNITGMDLRLSELMGKQLELFKEAVPTISRVAVLVDPAYPIADRIPTNMEQEARGLGVQLQRVEAGVPEAFEAAFTAMMQGGADAVLIMEPPSLRRTGSG